MTISADVTNTSDVHPEHTGWFLLLGYWHVVERTDSCVPAGVMFCMQTVVIENSPCRII